MIVQIDDELRNKIVDLLKKDITNAIFPANYKEDRNFYSYRWGFNCYSYAMQFKTDYELIQNLDRNVIYPYNPGYISRSDFYFPEDETTLFEFIKSDFNVLGLEFELCSKDDLVNKGEQKIAILQRRRKYLDGIKDAHFIRCNDNNVWSHMTGIDGRVEEVNELEDDTYKLINIVKLTKRT